MLEIISEKTLMNTTHCKKFVRFLTGVNAHDFNGLGGEYAALISSMISIG